MQHLINLDVQINRVDAGIIMPKFAATRQLRNNRYRNNEIRECGVLGGVIQSSESNQLNESQFNQEHARVSSSMNNIDTTIVQRNNSRKKKKKQNKKRRNLKIKAMALKARRMYDKTLGKNTYFNNINKQNGISKSYNFNIYVENGKVTEIPEIQSCNVSVQNQSQEIRVNKPKSFDELSEEEKSNPLFIAIIQDGYPNGESITNLHFQSLDNAIQMKLKNLKHGSFRPRFEYAYIKNKSVIVKCADKLSKRWIEHHIRAFHPWPKARLKPVSMDAIDRAYYRHIAGKTTLFLPNEESAITLLYRLQKQNPQLDLGSWNISTEEIFKRGHKGFLIHFGIPFSSLKVLESLEFKLFLGMGQVSLNVKLLY